MHKDLQEKFRLSEDVSNHWYNCASDLNAAARLLYAAQGQPEGHPTRQLELPSGFNFQTALHRPVLLNSGLALELILKACLIRSKRFDKNKHHGHVLVYLASEAEVLYTQEQMSTLRVLTDSVIWSGRYPIPKDINRLRENDENWSSLWKVTQFGSITVRGSDETKWPTFQNYVELWRTAERKYWEINPKDPREFRRF